MNSDFEPYDHHRLDNVSIFDDWQINIEINWKELYFSSFCKLNTFNHRQISLIFFLSYIITVQPVLSKRHRETLKPLT